MDSGGQGHVMPAYLRGGSGLHAGVSAPRVVLSHALRASPRRSVRDMSDQLCLLIGDAWRASPRRSVRDISDELGAVSIQPCQPI